MPCRPLPFILLLSFLAAGCAKPESERWAEAPPEPDTPLELKVNAKGQVWLGGKWRDVFADHAAVRGWLQSRSEQYRKVYRQRELGLPALRRGGQRVEFLPVPTLLVVEPKTKSGFVGSLKRVCREFGFTQVEVQVAEQPFEDG